MSRQWLFMVTCCITLTLFGCTTTARYITSGEIRQSVVYKPSVLHVDGAQFLDTALITISTSDIVIDFAGSVIDGRTVRTAPDGFAGVAVHILNCRNVTLRNLSIHGFRIAILAEHVENLRIEDCDLSYNYRPKLHSKWDRESLTDWLYYHNNERDEWKRYGAAIYLKHCDHAMIKGVTCQQGMNALLMVQCNNGLVYNNDFSFNSGLGIGLYRSSSNRIMHNKLDWNARGYSHGKYARGQDSSAILLYEQSSQNIIAYNSGTHSGDGVFLWAGQYTMDTGLGGCDSNLIYRNDFSHSIANGIEVTFSANVMIGNILNDSRYGIWGGYSHHSLMRGNTIEGCDYGIAIEHGNHNVIAENRIAQCPLGIQLWQRETQPPDWPYAQVLDVRSRNYQIACNTFDDVTTAMQISHTDSVFLSENTMTRVHEELQSSGAQIFTGATHWLDSPIVPPAPLGDGMDAMLPTGTLRGREYIIVNAWGPYDFQYPHLVLRDRQMTGDQEVFTLAVFGPSGTWSVNTFSGFDSVSHRAGAVPDTLIAFRSALNGEAELVLEYLGQQCIDQFGDTIRAGVPFLLRFWHHAMHTHWDVAFFAFDAASHPLHHPTAFTQVLSGTPLAGRSAAQLAYRWWGKPHEDVPPDQFAVVATTQIETESGAYLVTVESDDGVRIWIDDVLVVERWDIHTPTIDETLVTLSKGVHQLRVEYFDAGGLAVLDVSVTKVAGK